MVVLRVSVALAYLVGAAGATTTTDAIGPGPVSTVLRHGEDRIALSVSPNNGGLVDNTFVVRWSRGGKPVRGSVRALFTMQAMPMPSLHLALRPGSDGVYRGTGRVLTMPGRWEIRLRLRREGAAAFDVVVVDRVTLGIFSSRVA